MEIIRWENVPAEPLGEGAARQVVWGERGTLTRFEFVRGHHVSKHSHPAEQFTCVVSGVLRIALEGREWILRSGDMLVIPPDAEHEVWCEESTVVVDFFAPPRDDWKQGCSGYLAGR